MKCDHLWEWTDGAPATADTPEVLPAYYCIHCGNKNLRFTEIMLSEIGRPHEQEKRPERPPTKVKPPKPKAKRLKGCLTPGCPRPHRALGYCGSCYTRRRRTGVPPTARIRKEKGMGVGNVEDFVLKAQRNILRKRGAKLTE